MSYDSAFGQMMHNVFGAFDMAIITFFGSIQNDFFTVLAKFLSCFGEHIFIILLGVLCCCLVLFKRTRKIGLLLLFTIGFLLIFNHIVLKYFFVRLRPYNALQGNSQYFNWYLSAGASAESAYCFPSTHTCLVFATSIVLFYWAKFDLKKNAAVFIFIIPALVACARIYLMVHYPTDVIAGMIEGIIIGNVMWLCFRQFYRIQQNSNNKLLKIFNFDLEPWLVKKLGHEIKVSKLMTIIVAFLLCAMLIAFGKSLYSASHVQRCQHQGPDYICMNKPDSNLLTEIIGDEHDYCDIHK